MDLYFGTKYIKTYPKVDFTIGKLKQSINTWLKNQNIYNYSLVLLLGDDQKIGDEVFNSNRYDQFNLMNQEGINGSKLYIIKQYNLTGLKEIDLMILSNLEDQDLVSYCRTNNEAKQICNDQTFWLNRLRSRFPQIDLELMKEVKEGSWSDVYMEMVQFVRSVNRDNWISKRKKEGVISFQDKDTALVEASKNGYTDIVKYLVKEGANIHAYRDSALVMASEYGHLDIVNVLLKEGANNNGADWLGLDSALILASIFGHLDIVKFLVQNGADIHGQDDEAFRMASYNGQLEIVKYLVQNGANIHSRDDYALRSSSRNGHVEVVNYLKSLM